MYLIKCVIFDSIIFLFTNLKYILSKTANEQMCTWMCEYVSQFLVILLSWMLEISIVWSSSQYASFFGYQRDKNSSSALAITLPIVINGNITVSMEGPITAWFILDTKYHQ